MKLPVAFFLVALLTSPRGCHGYNILVFGVFPFTSHVMMLSVISNELVAQGHNVTFVTTKATRPHPNLNVIINENVIHLKPAFLDEIGRAGATGLATIIWNLGLDGTDKVLATDVLQKLINAPQDASQPKFDAILTETYCLTETIAAGFAQKFDCPLINYQPGPMTANIAYMVGNPYNPGYMPDYKMPFTSNMNLWQRIQNTYVALYLTLYQNLIYFPAQDKLLRKHFAPLGAAQWSYIGDILRQRQALTLVDTSHVLTDSIAHAPNVMDVGGLHIKPAQPLPKDIEDFISSSGEAGVIYFAMGSTISTENLGPARIETLCKLFGSLEQRVLWKFDSPELEKSSKLPPNVKLSKWFPQNDILAHPKCRLFITHGGVHSAFESIYHAVPMVIVPLFADQKQNGQKAEEEGYGLMVDFDVFDYEELRWKVHQVLYEPKYKTNVLRLSTIFRSESLHPLQKAIRSIEYVIAHRGAPHLKTKATSLPWYQTSQLDVIASCTLGLGLVLYTLVRIGTSLAEFTRGKDEKKPTKPDRNKKNK
ncbi:hypothetical protein M8J76_006827 [Diaphorina citri]|nr:hypothetical protein M8J75_006926 [Diaphorina citri]KAI5719207.1 hypothetical protein M8J76_006827 [Diaphorina citri]